MPVPFAQGGTREQVETRAAVSAAPAHETARGLGTGGGVLETLGFFEVKNATTAQIVREEDALAPPGDSINLQLQVPVGGLYHVKVGCTLSTRYLGSQKPIGKIRVRIAVERYVSLLAPA